MNSMLNFLRSIEESFFFLLGLESSVSKLTGSINKLQVDFFIENSLGSGMKSLSQNQRSFFGTDTTSFDKKEIVSDESVMGEASERIDVFLCKIILSHSIVFLVSFSESVDSLVDFGSMVETVVTCSSDGP